MSVPIRRNIKKNQQAQLPYVRDVLNDVRGNFQVLFKGYATR